MTIQSTWVRKDPPLQIDETVIVTCSYSKFKGKVAKIEKILGPMESPWMRTDRWMSDWFVLSFDGEQEGFLEDEIERHKP
jgi:hypothetical protein